MFEVPSCGGFLLTGFVDDIPAYFDIGREIVCFNDPVEVVGQIRYYLKHEEERAAIATAGFRRARREHTYVHRFSEIFNQIGIPCRPVEAVLEEPCENPYVLEIR